MTAGSPGVSNDTNNIGTTVVSVEKFEATDSLVGVQPTCRAGILRALKIGALSNAGGGLFVGCVVAGAIMLANGGAKARGALMRDVSAYCIGVVAITAFMWTGEMTFFRSAVLLVIYAAFVITVLGADLWHIFTR